MNIHQRLHTSEQLDDLTLSGEKLQNTLASLKWINSFFGNHRQLAKAIVQYCKRDTLKKKYHIVDIGCGGGDSIHFISKKLKQHAIDASFTGIDGNPESTSYAIKQNSGASNINFKVADILNKEFTIPNCDLLICSHFIYHFSDEDLVHFLKKINQKGVKYIILSELYRSKIAYNLFKTIRHITPISLMAKKDGLLAIQRAFTMNELHSILKQSGIKKFKIYRKLFFRMIVKIELKPKTDHT